MAKKRLDVLLVENDMFESREKARAAIMAGEIFVEGKKVDKAGMAVEETAEINFSGKKLPYVSRGGLKLARAIEVFDLDLAGQTVLDVGASTGGFTDCALQNGAAKVYAVDVGYGQLAWSLRQDARVIVLEKTNARYLSKEMIPEPVDLVTIDVAFISLDKILPAIFGLLAPNGKVVALIKPQFEAGKDQVGKKGVVKDPAIHKTVIEKVVAAAKESGLQSQALTYSPITGPEGNIEYLILLAKKEALETLSINKVIEEAWSFLKKDKQK